MKIRIHRIDRSLPMPQYYTQGSVGFDIYCREHIDILPHNLVRLPTNLIVEVPQGYMLYLKDRSSTAAKGLLATAGIVDQDFCGTQDEILFQVYNYTDKTVTIQKGERIAQGILVQIGLAEWEEAESLSPTNRGGFGSTDTCRSQE